MKGLLLKDIYMLFKYCRSFVLIIVVFLGSSFFNKQIAFFSIYACMITGIIPSTLLSYDEVSRWDVYCGTLPCSRAQIVSSKYIIGLAGQLITALIFTIASIISSIIKHDFQNDLGFLIILMIILPCLSSGVSLPLMFKFGVTKARFLFYILFIIIAAVAYAVGSLMQDYTSYVNSRLAIIAAAVLCISIYVVSWFVSIRLYKKREII